MNKEINNLSKFISLILRHKPETINLKLDKNGYANVDELIEGINDSGKFINLDMLECIVKSDEKCRYSFNQDKSKIRANQGHSINVDLKLKTFTPPKYLYHGTSNKNLDNILKSGIKKMNRLHVHLSDNIDLATKVGSRHGKPIVLEVSAQKMSEEGYTFYLSENNVWLTNYVPKHYIMIIK